MKFLGGINEKALLRFVTGVEYTIILVKSSAVVGKNASTMGPMVQFMEENSTYAKHLGNLHEL